MSDTTALAVSMRSAMKNVLLRVAVSMVALALVAALFALISYAGASADTPPPPRHPFAAGVSETAPSPTGIGGAILTIQSGFYARMIAALQAFSTQGAALWTLVALSFAYGVFHAAGPGHGKAVISGYLVADGRRSMGRGLALAFASSLLQALSAIVIVGVLTVALNATAAAVSATAQVIEQASFALVAIVGLLVLWRKAGRLTTLTHTPLATKPASSSAASDDPFAGVIFQPAGAFSDRMRLPDRQKNSQSHDINSLFGSSKTEKRSSATGAGRFRAEAADALGDAACNDPFCGAGGLCRHTHILTPSELEQIDTPRDMAMVALSAGLRPCTGAIIVLVFAFANGMPVGGIAATFAMALGTFITVGALASLAVFAKRLATGLARGTSGENSRTGAQAIAALEVLAAASVAVIGALLLLS